MIHLWVINTEQRNQNWPVKMILLFAAWQSHINLNRVVAHH